MLTDTVQSPGLRRDAEMLSADPRNELGGAARVTARGKASTPCYCHFLSFFVEAKFLSGCLLVNENRAYCWSFLNQVGNQTWGKWRTPVMAKRYETHMGRERFQSERNDLGLTSAIATWKEGRQGSHWWHTALLPQTPQNTVVNS